MQHSLVEQLKAIESDRAVLSSVISGMREALLLVGADRRVRLVNDALTRIFELDFDPQGRLLVRQRP